METRRKLLGARRLARFRNVGRSLMFGRFRVLRSMRRSRHDHAKNLSAVMCRGNCSALLAIRAVARSTRAESACAYPATFCQSSKCVLRLGRVRLGARRFCLRNFRARTTTPLVGSHPGYAHGRRLSRASSLALPERRRGASTCRGKGGEISTTVIAEGRGQR